MSVNMVSYHYVLKGEFRLRLFDRITDDGTHLVIEPTCDEHTTVASHPAISDERNNVQWLTALSDSAFTFDVLVADRGGKSYEADNIDPDAAEKIADNQIRARKLSVAEAPDKYGCDTHHDA
jgi:hypothetical protein